MPVLAVSRDSPHSHRAYSDRLSLTIPLLSDWTGQAVRGFGVAQVMDGLVDAPVRSCFLIDAGGVVRGAWRYDDSELPDLDELLEAARTMHRAGGGGSGSLS